MKKVIQDVDQKRGIVQITIADERWYMRPDKDEATGLPIYKAVPSVTWIAHHYPKGIGYMKWLAEHGWDESQAIMREAGDKGSKVHLAISAIQAGEEVRIDSEFLNKSTGKMEELTYEEVECIFSFVNWRKEMEEDYVVEFLNWDLVVFSDIHNYAGSIDSVIRLTPKEDGKNPLKLTGPTTIVVDYKTSKQVWPSFEMQVSAYRKALENGENPIHERNTNGTEGKLVDVSGLKMAILQLGYTLNRKGWKWNDISDKFALFIHAQGIWANETAGEAPKVREIPIVLSPAVSVEEAMGITEKDLDKSIETLVGEEPAQSTLPVAPHKGAKAK
jgi:hypothetical protein